MWFLFYLELGKRIRIANFLIIIIIIASDSKKVSKYNMNIYILNKKNNFSMVFIKLVKINLNHKDL